MASMTTEGRIPSDDLNALIASGRITEEALREITGIPAETMSRFLHEDVPDAQPRASMPLLTGDESRRVSMLSAFLFTGLSIDDDERLRAILESLTAECHLTPDNI